MIIEFNAPPETPSLTFLQSSSPVVIAGGGGGADEDDEVMQIDNPVGVLSSEGHPPSRRN